MEGDSDIQHWVTQFRTEYIDLTITKEVYDKWSHSYDQNYNESSDRVHIILGDVVEAWYNQNGSLPIVIMDVAAGTGRIAGEILRRGIVCTADAIDGSQMMKEQAMKKQIYRNYLVELVNDQRLDIDTDSYNVLLLAEGLSWDQISYPAFPEMIRITKAGGLVVFASFDLAIDKPGFGNLEDEMQKHVVAGNWSVVSRSVHQGQYYGNKDCIVWVFRVEKSEPGSL